MTRHRIVWTIAFLAACSHKTAEQTLLKDVGPAISWVATLQFVAQTWLADRIPDSYVRLTIADAEKALDKAAKIVEQTPARNALRDEIRRQFETSRTAAEHLREAVEKNDRQGVARSIQRFASANAALQSLQQQQSP